MPTVGRGEPGCPREKMGLASGSGQLVTADGLPRSGPDRVPLVWAFIIEPASHSLEDVF